MNPPPSNVKITEAKEEAAALLKNAEITASVMVHDAVPVAEDVVSVAAAAAKRLLDESDAKTTRLLADALREVFGEREKASKFVDVSQVPLLCFSVKEIRNSIAEMKDMMEGFDSKFASKLTEKIVYGLITLIVTGFFVALASVAFVK